MRKRILALLLTLCILLGAAPPIHAEAADSIATVVYIPMDNRPFHDEQVKTLAEALRIELVMPPEYLYSNKLDGQGANDSGLQCGDRAALLSWLKEKENTCDTFVIALDQLLSGGLLSSRAMEEMESLTFSDGTSMTEFEVIDYLSELAESNTVYIIDSVMRLATSVDYDGFNLDHYNLFRRYAAVSRPVLSGSSLTVQNITANYRLYQDGTSQAYAHGGFSSGDLTTLLSPKSYSAGTVVSSVLAEAYLSRDGVLPVLEESESAAPMVSEANDSLLSSYLRIRTRKLTLTDYAMKHLCGNKNVHYLLGVDDSSTGNNIQTNEIALFRTYLSGQDQIFSALDGLAQTAISKIFQSCHALPATSVSVSYLGDGSDQVQAFNCDTPREIMDQALRYYGCTQTAQDPDVSVVVVTAANGDSGNMLCRLVSQLNENEADHIPTILVDLTENREKDLNQMLVENVHLGMLLCYSGSNETPNGIVMALSQGLARYWSLCVPGCLTDEAQTAYLKNLSASLVREIAYNDSAKAEMDSYLSGLGLDQSNFGAISESTRSAVNQRLTQTVTGCAAALLQNLTSGNFITSLSPYACGSIQSLSVSQCGYPWLRQMEISCTLSAAWSASARDSGAFHRAYVNGTSLTTFSPGTNITRQESAKMLVAAVGLSVDPGATASPQDVSSWARPYVNAALKKGYFVGYPDGSFRGDNPITRSEFAAMIMQYAKAEGLSFSRVRSPSFADLPRSSKEWYTEYVYTLADGGIIYGDTDGNFRPNDPISRAEAVTMLNRLFQRGQDMGETLTDSLARQFRFADTTSGWYVPHVQEASISHYSK